MTPVLQWLEDPTLVYIFLVMGGCAALAELAHPGAFVPGISGALLLLLAGLGLALLPVNSVGLALVILALLLFALDAAVTTHGGPTIAGLAAFAAGSLMLFNVPGDRGPAVSPLVIAPLMLAGAGFSAALVRAGMRSRHVPAMNGPQRLLGATGVVVSDLRPLGAVRVGGEVWSAKVRRAPAPEHNLPTAPVALLTQPRSEDSDNAAVTSGQAVRIVGRRGLTLEVEPVTPAGGDAAGAA